MARRHSIRYFLFFYSLTSGKRLFRLWLCHPLRSAKEINARLDAADTLSSMPQIRDDFLATFSRLPDLERLISRIHGGRCKVKDFVRVLEGFQSIMEGIERIKNEGDEKLESGLVGKLLCGFDCLDALLKDWEHAFDWEKAKEESILLDLVRNNSRSVDPS
jgi:DNA mismatch repair protein MSH6